MDQMLRPLPYHREVAAVLEMEQPKAFAALLPTGSTPDSEVHESLLRHAYRLDPAGHPVPHAAVARAAAALEVQVPVDLFAFEGRLGGNAELIFVPERPVIVLSGDTLNLLDADELCAVVGHELAHYVLWTVDSGRHLAASRLLDAAETDARTDAEYLETARRLRLATELFADRGALLSCGSLTTTLRALLKLTTGLADVDPDGYLRQAAEVDLGKPSSGTSHPETVLRAWALQEWQRDNEAAEPAISRALGGLLDLNTLDVLDQDRLRGLTETLVRSVLLDAAMRTDEVIDHAAQFGVKTSDTGPVEIVVDDLAPETRRYLACVLLDFATVDAELGADGIARMLLLARRQGLGPELDKQLGAELDLSDRARNKVRARVEDLAGA